ncbi:MAG: hypothetical protein AAF610_01840 [Pseudomonadota bacterium]
MKMKNLILAGTFAAAMATPQAMANTLQITGGSTQVELTSFDALTSLGLSVSIFGTAKLDASGPFPVASFLVTGGTVDSATGFASIEHDGSGLGLSNGTDSVELANFLVDTESLLLSGDVSVNGSFVANLDLFSITSSLELLLTAGAADALNGVYGTALPEGLSIGFATPNVTTVPVPAALPLFASALAGLGFARSRKRAA